TDAPVTIGQLAAMVVRLVNPGLAIEHIPYDQAFPSGFEDVRCRIPDLARICSTIAYKPRRCLEEIVSEVIRAKQGRLLEPARMSEDLTQRRKDAKESSLGELA